MVEKIFIVALVFGTLAIITLLYRAGSAPLKGYLQEDLDLETWMIYAVFVNLILIGISYMMIMSSHK